MNELKDHRMVVQIAQQNARTSPKSERDLRSLARQLTTIADELSGRNDSRSADTPVSLIKNPQQAPSPTGLSGALSKSRETLPDLSDIRQVRALNAEFAREAYATRRRRSSIFGNPELFGEPAWDILLDLYIAHVERKAVSVSSACIGSAAPPTTGLRWLGVLTEEGLIRREHDPEDQRRVLVRLTERGLEAMDQYFSSAGLTA